MTNLEAEVKELKAQVAELSWSKDYLEIWQLTSTYSHAKEHLTTGTTGQNHLSSRSLETITHHQRESSTEAQKNLTPRCTQRRQAAQPGVNESENPAEPIVRPPPEPPAPEGLG